MPHRLVPNPPGDEPAAGYPHRLETPAGPIHAVWDAGEPVTGMGPLAYFAQFLHASGLWAETVGTCPLSYTSPNAPRIAEVLGTLLLTVLSGGNRYLHASAVRFDPVIGQLLGMRKVLSHEAVRRAIARPGQDLMQEWLRLRLVDAVRPALREPWILDEDVTSRIVYGTQEGAVVGYNGKKPGHPSLALHTYVVAHLRLVLDVQVKPGNQTSGAHGHQGLISLITALPPALWPALVRGDIAYGFEDHMAGLEHLGVNYLFKVRRSDGVKELIATASARSDWQDAGKGWQGVDTTLRLLTWTRARRAVIIRRPETARPAVRLGRRPLRETALADGDQQTFLAAPPTSDGFEYAVLITSLDRPVAEVAQFYRDRADAENVNDELKNHWGWGGFTTADLDRTAIMARFTALVYNWWTLYCRGIMPHRHTEVATARPLLVHGIGRLTTHGGQRTLRLTGCAHASRDIAAALTARARTLSRWFATVAQLDPGERWRQLGSQIIRSILDTWGRSRPFSTPLSGA